MATVKLTLGNSPLTCDNEQKADGESKVTCQDLTPIAQVQFVSIMATE